MQEKCTAIRVGTQVVAYLRDTVLDVRRERSGLLTTPPGFALALSTLAQAEAGGCTEIQLTVKNGPKYCISFKGFMDNCFPVKRGGYESQRGITFDYCAQIGGPKIGRKKSLRILDKMRRPKKPQQPTFRGW